MGPARLAAPAAVSRWTDEEHDILVDMTNEQLALEWKDKSKVISWSRHWENISQRLREYGHNRTPAACHGYWKRTMETQKANEEAAGARWDDAEHQILLGMTEDQLALEAADPSSVMTWPRHWKKVSRRLQENGYTRTVDACAAYWVLVQENSPLAAGTGMDSDEDSAEVDGPVDDPVEEVPEEITEAEGPVIEVAAEEEQVVQEVKPSKDEENASSHVETPQESSPDVDLDAGSDAKIVESQTPSLSARWSTVNTPEPAPVVHKPREIVSEKQPTSDPSTPVEVTFSVKTLDSSSSSSRLQGENETPLYMPSFSYQTDSSQRPKGKVFRFQPAQRAVLEAEANRNGCYPDLDRREELANTLGVEEKTIRNWFVHHRRDFKKNQEGPHRSNSYPPPVGESFSVEEPEIGIKRNRDSMDGDSLYSIEDAPVHPVKRYRFDSEPHPENVRKFEDGSHTSPDINPLTGNVRRKAPLRAISSMYPYGSPGPRNTEIPGPGDQTNRSFSSPNSTPDLGRPSSSQSAPQLNVVNVLPSNDREPAFTQGTHWTSVIRSQRIGSAEIAPSPPPMNHRDDSQRSLLPNKPVKISPEPSSVEPPPSGAESVPMTDAQEEKARALKKVAGFKAEIQSLKRDSDTRVVIISRIEQEAEEVKREEAKLQQQKSDEIARVLREIDERYHRDCELLRDKQNGLQKSKESELEALKRNEVQVARKQTGLELYQRVIDFHESSEEAN